MKLSEMLAKDRESLEQRERELKDQINELQNELMSVRLELTYSFTLDALDDVDFVPLVGVPRTSKNIQMHRAWLAVQYAFRDDVGNRGLEAEDIKMIMVGYITDLKDTTFRAYLHRFKKDGLIEKRSSGRWFLVTQ